MLDKILFQSEYHILKKSFEEKLPKDIIIGMFEKQNEITDLGVSPYQLLKKWRKRLETNLMLYATFIDRLKMFQTIEN